MGGGVGGVAREGSGVFVIGLPIRCLSFFIYLSQQKEIFDNITYDPRIKHLD